MELTVIESGIQRENSSSTCWTIAPNNGNRKLGANLFDDIQNLLFGEAVFDGMVHLDPHYLSDVLQYMFLNLTER
jgi:hypothetical protein